ncbi:MAG TPA: class II glutamine amidotransferase [Actinomycetota bacterium]|nr:class II glutamine amidotransferase [Actinomycetota bacterium]
MTYESGRHYVSLADRELEEFVVFGRIFPRTGPIWRNHHMCRLLAFASMPPSTPQELIGDDLASFVSLSQEHGDGWGMGWYEDDGELNVAKDVGAAHASDLLGKLSRTTETRAMVMHLRKASPGLSIALENTHPFTAGGLAFAHNGWIRPIPELEDLLDPGLRYTLRGTTDSERYFQLLLAAMEPASDVERALPPLLGRLRKGFRYNALNFVLLTERRLYAVCEYSVEAVARRGEPDYYTLGYKAEAGAVVVGSSGCWGERPAWRTLANHQALVVDRGSLQTEVLDLR